VIVVPFILFYAVMSQGARNPPRQWFIVWLTSNKGAGRESADEVAREFFSPLAGNFGPGKFRSTNANIPKQQGEAVFSAICDVD